MTLPEFPISIEVRQGDDYLFEVAYYEDDDETPISMDGKTMSLTIKPAIDEDDTDAAAEASYDTADFTVDEDEEVVGGGVNNRVGVLIVRSLIHAMDVGTHYIDFQVLDDATNILKTVAFGQFNVLDQVSRREPT